MMESVTARPDLPQWEPPTVEEISVSAEVTGYMGRDDDPY